MQIIHGVHSLFGSARLSSVVKDVCVSPNEEEDEPSGGAVPRLARRVCGRGRSGLYILLDVSSQPATTPRVGFEKKMMIKKTVWRDGYSVQGPCLLNRNKYTNPSSSHLISVCSFPRIKPGLSSRILQAHDPWDSSRADHLHLQPRDKTSTNIIWFASSTLFPLPQKPRSTLKANLTNQATVRTVSTRAVFQAKDFIVFSRNRQSQIIYRTKTLQLAPRADSCTPSDHSNRLVSTLGPWITSQTTSSIESSIHHHPSTDSPMHRPLLRLSISIPAEL
ncbi:uncharacterized protein PGTG_09443 [Puccinia graminis f. sp. tritici CRL 75-36-700-3]|uniref:Uncharacterized protein n=1 Tax=Puccinia graminis f. sp. tritici (strain CRL 75-36-700-3 / race SCCL) TaxID=418459 RepID=E3KHF5_PUCGT|nr:uncharacterized protein PGTG_09443 [Puccinia graminis f. sp. tritici CRL 75-36-700-3]EFP83730.1 hypothetical protein PGTG_09443 [Puccinia graminis f. sp. tritici CRL 75-36-700-3]